MRLLVRAAAICLLIAGAALADEQSDFEKGRNAYLARDFQDSEARFKAMLDPKSERALHSTTLIDHAHTYLGATYIALGKPKNLALLEFKSVLLHNDTYRPDPLTFPTEVLNSFSDARDLFNKEILAEKERRAQEERERKEREEREREKQRRYLAALEQQASEQIETKVNRRWIAFLPFGIGQFQNGHNVLGLAFLGGEAALLAGVVITGGFAAYNFDQRNQWVLKGDPARTSFIDQYQARYNTAIIANYVFDGALLLAAAAGILQANLAFVPSTTTTKPRPLPKITFQIGAGVGLQGSF